MTKFYQIATIIMPVRQGERGGDEAGLPDARSLASVMGQGLGREVIVASHTTNEHVLADLREIRRFMLMQANEIIEHLLAAGVPDFQPQPVPDGEAGARAALDAGLRADGMDPGPDHPDVGSKAAQ